MIDLYSRSSLRTLKLLLDLLPEPDGPEERKAYRFLRELKESVEERVDPSDE